MNGLLPIKEGERAKRAKRAAEHLRLFNVHGGVTVTRNAAGYIIKTEKVAEDVVIERTFTRDASNFITKRDIRIVLKKKVT